MKITILLSLLLISTMTFADQDNRRQGGDEGRGRDQGRGGDQCRGRH